VHALVADAIDRSVRFTGDTDIEGLYGLLDDTVIRRRTGDAAALASTGSYPPPLRYLPKLLKTGIIALPLTVTAIVGLAADYEIFAATATVETGVNHYAVERLYHKNKKLHHCTAVLDAETKQLTGQCTERPGFPEKPTGNGPNAQGGMSNMFGGVPVMGSWKIDQIAGKTEFCISRTAQCVEVTPQ
jgi:hypothetical protein